MGPLGAHRGWGIEGLLLQRKKGRRVDGHRSLGQASLQPAYLCRHTHSYKHTCTGRLAREAAQEGDKLQAGRQESLVPRKLVGERKTMRKERG